MYYIFDNEKNVVLYNRVESKGPSRGGRGLFIKSEIRKYVKIHAHLNDENFMWCKRLTKATSVTTRTCTHVWSTFHQNHCLEKNE